MRRSVFAEASLLLLPLLLSSQPADAAPIEHEPSASEIIAHIGSNDLVDVLMLSAEGQGMEWTQAFAVFSKTPRIFCLPESIVMDSASRGAMLKAYVERHPATGKLDVGGVLLKSYIAKFPCAG